MESPERAHYLGAEGANLTKHFSIENMIINEIVLIIPYSESLCPPLPQVKTKDVFGGNIWCFVGQGLGDKDNGTQGE